MPTLRSLRIRYWDSKQLKGFRCGAGVTFNVPVGLRGAGTVQIGARTCLGTRMGPRLGRGDIMLQTRSANALIDLGVGNWLSNNICIISVSEVRIGDGCQIGDQVMILDADFHNCDASSRNAGHGKSAPVRIPNNVWLGTRVVVLKGISIGENSVIGAMSLVTKDIPANCVAGGVPAKVLKRL
jgi:maltose O-acetyltransferase